MGDRPSPGRATGPALCSVQHLPLHDGAALGGGAFKDDEVAPLGFRVAAHDLAELRTIWRIGPVVLTMAEPAGLVMKAESGSISPLPSGWRDRASR